MQRNIKKEPVVPKQNWTLVAVSEAARKWCNRYALELNRTYKIGRSKKNEIHLPTSLCSKQHCMLQVSENEVILKDQSLHGTRVNHTSFKDSRCILVDGDLIGFGCATNTRHLKDKVDRKYFVYRFAIGNGLNSNEPIEILSDDSDDEANSTRNTYCDGFRIDSDTGDEDENDHSTDDETDVKPDIHSLMRMEYAKVQIKQEIDWNCHEYEKTLIQPNEQRIVNDVPFCLSDDDEEWGDDEDIIALEPPQKRIRQSKPEYYPPTPDHEPEPEPEQRPMELFFTKTISLPPEYQMSDTIFKEKCKVVVRSRGQNLATDMLMSKKTIIKNMNDKTKGANKMSTGTAGNHEASTSCNINHAYRPLSEYSEYTIQDLVSAFISEITKWEFQWIVDQKPNPLRYTMDVKRLDTNFTDLNSFQRQMKMFLLMETYSIIYTEYHSKSRDQLHQAFTKVESSRFDENLERIIYNCSTQSSDCQAPQIYPGDCTILKYSQGQRLAFVTRANRTKDGWEYEMQSTQGKNKNQTKLNYIQVSFVTNVQAMLECFISLYELKKSSLQDAFLHPSIQYEDMNGPADSDFVKKDDRENILDQIYEKCAVSIFGSSKILLVNGGAGTGKTGFICDLLERFSSENFQFTTSILVCGRNDTLVDSMAAKVLPKISSIARFGKLSNMRRDIHRIGVEKLSPKLKEVKIVFIALHNCVDLIHADRSFDVCIVDDASLCSEAELLPLFRLKLTTLLLVGDKYMQTSTTQNECCRENGYSRSLFTRVIVSYKQFDSNRTLFPTLYTQRRMLREICLWPNQFFYNNKMVLAPITRVKRTVFQPYTIFQVNTLDDIEVEFVRHLLEFCIENVKPKRCSYGIICGHPSSKIELENMINANKQFAGIEVSGYDSFQGQEKDVILMVALKPEYGFELFSTKESLMIALTRAKESLVFCGNFQHVTTKVDSMTSIWMALLGNAKQRCRFFDLNGTFDESLVSNLISKTK